MWNTECDKNRFNLNKKHFYDVSFQTSIYKFNAHRSISSVFATLHFNYDFQEYNAANDSTIILMKSTEF